MNTALRCLPRAHSTSSRRYYTFGDLPDVNHLNLKRVPIPDLTATLQNYQNGVKHFCEEGEWAEQQELVEDFMKQAKAMSLQEKLMEAEAVAEKNGTPHFHFEKYWDDMYLEMKCSCPIYSNPYYIFEGLHDGDQASSAARITFSALKWWDQCKNGQTPVESNKAGPLCMGTYPYLIGTARIPGITRDVIESYPNETHVVAIFKGQFYKVEAVGKTVSELKQAFSAIMKDGETREQGNAAILTSTGRVKWAENRVKLLNESDQNKQSVSDIDKGLFTVSLDRYGSDPSIETLCRSHLTGLFSDNEKTTSNRWWDKIGFTIDNRNHTGLVMEHAPADGAYWNSWLEGTIQVYDSETTKDTSTPATTDSSPWHHLPISVPSAMLEDAQREFQQAANSVDLSVISNESFSASNVKSSGFSPDALFQVSAQVAYHNLFGHYAGTYESASMRNFWRGRTETIRSSQSTIPALVQSLKSGSSAQAMEALTAACAMQTQVTKNALQGKGIDRHLLSLSKQYEAHSSQQHPLFKSQPYVKSSTWLLSTSNVTSEWLRQFGFGAVTENGLGLGYQTKKNNLTCTISSYEQGKSKKFENQLLNTMEQFLDMKKQSS